MMPGSMWCYPIVLDSAEPTHRWSCSATWRDLAGCRTWGRGKMSDIMKGRRGLIMGVANDHSIAWGIAQALYQHGAELAFTYQGEAFGRRVKPLAAKVGSSLRFPCDVEDVVTVDQVFAGLTKAWGTVDFLVHAIAYS